MPRMTTCVLGRALTSLPLPSFVTSTIEPVSATAKFAPVIPTSAVSNTARSCRRAAAVSFSSSGRSSLPSTAPRRAATSTAVFSIAGAMMWAGCSPASWRMYSPRSVSTTRSPSRSSASFRRISSLAIDFDFATSRASPRRQMSRIVSAASPAVAAKCTWPPRASSARENSSRYRSRSSIVRCLISRPRSRSSSTSGNSPHAARRASRSRPVAASSAGCVCPSSSARPAAARNRSRG